MSHDRQLTVVDFNTLVAGTDAAANTAIPVAEWMSDIRTPSETRSPQTACLLFDFYLNKYVFQRVRFEMIYRTTDSERIEKKLLLSVSNDGVRDHVKDVFHFSLENGISRYQVGNVNSQTVADLRQDNRRLIETTTTYLIIYSRC